MSAVMNQVSEVVDITPKNQPAALVVMSPGQLVSQLMQQGGSMDLSAMERLMGLVLTAIAIQMLLSGIENFIGGLE